MSSESASRRVHLFEGPWLRASILTQDSQPATTYNVNGVEYHMVSALRVLHQDGSIGYDVDVVAAAAN